MPNRFGHLHVHTDASPDGMGPVETLVKIAKSKGFESLAITDHGSLANIIPFVFACEAQGIKPIIGTEGYVEFEGGMIGHLTLLADGDIGYKSLVKLQNIAHAKFENPKPCFTIDELCEHAEGLVLLSGCIASPLHQLPYNDALQLARRFKRVFEDRFFIEVMTVTDDPNHWDRPMRLSKDLGIKRVATNDVHFALKDNADIHRKFLEMRIGHSYSSERLYLATEDEMKARAHHLGIAGDLAEEIERAYKISRLIKTPQVKRAPYLPSIENCEAMLRSIVYSSEVPIPAGQEAEYAERTEYELKIITDRDFCSYFIILHDMVNFARSIGAKIGPGRGSGAGSLLLYRMGITKIDPIVHKLRFERFLNPMRKGYPDVDTDIDSESRARVIDYAVKKWKAMPVSTYSAYSHKTAVHELFKYFHLPREDEQTAADFGPESKEFKKHYDANPDFARIYDTIIGQIKNRGVHAGGVTPVPDNFLPIERTAKNDLAIAFVQGHDEHLSAAGGVKFDILGLSMLSILKAVEEMTGIKSPSEFDIPEGHPLYKEIFAKGNLTGVFQFMGSDGIRKFTMEVKPDKFGDIVAINALYRPGTLDVGMAQLYPQLKLKPRKIHPKIDPIVEDTYGIFPYQEQIMDMFVVVTGGTLADADVARKLLMKAKHGEPDWIRDVQAMGENFITRGIANGFDKELLEELWKEAVSHSHYSFNKSHATAYALLALQSAWWKYHYPIQFYCALLNNDPSEASVYIYDAVAHGIEIVPPHANKAGVEWTYDGNKIFAPLSIIKYMGEKGAKALVAARGSKEFESKKDFITRVPKREVAGRARLGMLMLGSFDGIPGAESELLIKEVPTMGTNQFELQQKYMGFCIPTPHLLNTIDEYTKKGFVGGIITEVKDKESSYGPYKSFHFANGTACWSRDHVFKEGDIVFVKPNKNTGRILSAVQYEES